LDRLKANPDPVAIAEGTQRQTAFERLARLTHDRAELEQPGFIHRFGILVRHLDRPLAEATVADFVPAAPLNPEGLFFASLGLMTGLLVSGGLVGSLALLTASSRRIRYRPKPSPHRMKL
jgi:hypothetical protein